MEKYNLSKNCRNIITQLHNNKRKLLYRENDYRDIKYLISKGLITAKELSGKRFGDLSLTEKGAIYLYENPKLKNPSIWDDKKYCINTIISVIALIVAIIALFKN